MRLRLVAGYGALVAALGVACGGRIVGSHGEPVQAEGGAPRSSVDAAADAGSSDDSISLAPMPSLPADGDACCCENGATCPQACSGVCPPAEPDAMHVVNCEAFECPPGGPLDAGGQSDAAEAGACGAGCACFSSEWQCRTWDCVWNGASCLEVNPGGGSDVTSGTVTPNQAAP